MKRFCNICCWYWPQTLLSSHNYIIFQDTVCALHNYCRKHDRLLATCGSTDTPVASSTLLPDTSTCCLKCSTSCTNLSLSIIHCLSRARRSYFSSRKSFVLWYKRSWVLWSFSVRLLILSWSRSVEALCSSPRTLLSSRRPSISSLESFVCSSSWACNDSICKSNVWLSSSVLGLTFPAVCDLLSDFCCVGS